MGDKLVSERNLRFLLYEVFDLESLTHCPMYEEHNKEIFEIVFETAVKMAYDLFLPCFAEMDRNPPEFSDNEVKVHPMVSTILKQLGEGGWISANAPFELGGQQLPHLLTAACRFIFSAANYSASVYAFLNTGAAHLIESFGSQELIDTYIPKIFEGEWQGTMALTEPQAGSSLTDISTRAVPTDQDYYRISGQKIFISAADHTGTENVVHLMLAKIKGAPPGVKGISLFVVPKKRIEKDGSLVSNDVNTAGIYHKLGYRGSPIVQLSLGERDDCRGYLVGEPNKGLSYMFQMMNEGRIDVAIGAAGIASAAYYASLEYAKTRPQGRKLSAKDPTSPPVPIINHPDVKRMLFFQRAVVDGSVALLLQCSKYVDMIKVSEGEEKERYSMLLDILTPAAKTYPSEMGVLSVSQGLQCLGGYGYCDEFPLEQYYRDVRIHPIHEGTTGIQGLDLLGRKVTMNNGRAFSLYIDEVEKAVRKAETFPGLEFHAHRLRESLERLRDVTAHLLRIADSGETERFLADAVPYLELFGIVTVAWQWLLQGSAAFRVQSEGLSEAETRFYQGKLRTMDYFYRYELPKADGLVRLLTESEGLTAKAEESCFDD